MKTLNMNLVSASSANHFLSQMKWLESVFRHNSPRRVVVWDLGWRPAQKREIEKKWEGRVLFRTFNYPKYPEWFNIGKQRGQYAWKPCLIRETADEFPDAVLLWMDAGCLVDSHLEEILSIAKTHGIFCSCTTGTLGSYTDDRTLDYMRVPSPVRDTRMRAATVAAFDPACSEAAALLNEWARLARIKECIAPEGSSKGGPDPHRQDQSVLTALLALRGFTDRLPVHRPGFRIHCDEETRLKKLQLKGSKNDKV